MKRTTRRWIIAGSIIGVLLVGTGIYFMYAALTGVFADKTLRAETIPPPPMLRAVTAPGSSIMALREVSNTRSPLLLFLPATGAQTRSYGAFVTTAAKAGYHVIALPYANLHTERGICMSNAGCYGQVRAEQLTGAPSPFLPPPAHDASVQTVLPLALKQLAQHDPSGDWGQYVQAGAIDWSNIVVSGHSQGGGLAAYIAHQKSVKGVIMFSSPNDVYPRTHTTATWLKGRSATPASRYYGFMDTHDYYAPFTTAAWRAMLPGVAVTKSDNVKQLNGQLLSTSTVHFPQNLTAHFAVARDTAYAPVWRYLLEKAQ